MDKAFWKRLWLVLAVFAANYGLDRITKILALAKLLGEAARVYLDGLMVLVYAENDGAFLGRAADGFAPEAEGQYIYPRERI